MKDFSKTFFYSHGMKYQVFNLTAIFRRNLQKIYLIYAVSPAPRDNIPFMFRLSFLCVFSQHTI